jgi:hypothetical protein
MYAVGIWGDVAGNRRVVRPVVAESDPRTPKEYLRELIVGTTEFARVLIPSPIAKLPPGAESTPCFVGDLSSGAGANRAELAKKMRAPDLVLGEGITWHCRHCCRRPPGRPGQEETRP